MQPDEEVGASVQAGGTVNVESGVKVRVAVSAVVGRAVREGLQVGDRVKVEVGQNTAEAVKVDQANGAVSDGRNQGVGERVTEYVRARVGVAVPLGLGVGESVLVDVEVAVQVGVWVGVKVEEGVKVRVFATGWNGVRVEGAGDLLTVATAVAVGGKGVEEGTNGRSADRSVGRVQPASRRINNDMGNKTCSFKVMTVQVYQQ